MATPILVRRSVRDEAAASDQRTRLADVSKVNCGEMIHVGKGFVTRHVRLIQWKTNILFL